MYHHPHHHESRAERREELREEREWEREREFREEQRELEFREELREERMYEADYGRPAYIAPPPAYQPAYQQQPVYQQAPPVIVSAPSAPPIQAAPIVIHGRFKHAHLFHHHGRMEHRLPNDFFVGSEIMFREPGGEEIVYVIPAGLNLMPGQVITVEW